MKIHRDTPPLQAPAWYQNQAAQVPAHAAPPAPAYDPNATTIRIGKDGERYKVCNADGEELFKIPAGTKVINLGKEGDKVKVVVWQNGAYQEGYLEAAAFEHSPTLENPLAKEVFVQDARRIIAQINNRAGGPQNTSNSLGREIYAVLLQIESDLADIESGKLALDTDHIKRLQAVMDQKFAPGGDEKIVTRANMIPTAIQEVIQEATQDPGTAGYLSRTLILPFTGHWFRDNGLEDHYNAVWGPLGLIISPGGIEGDGKTPQDDTGEVVYDEEKLGMFKNALTVLKGILASGHTAAQTPEGRWLMGFDPGSIDHTERIVVMGKWSWNASTDDRFAGGVGMDDSFGPIHSHQALTLAIHEINVGSTLLPNDTHINPEEQEAALNVAKSSGINDAFFNNSEHIDDLYGTESYIALIDLAIMLRELRHLDD